jgi:hypothetical protein
LMPRSCFVSPKRLSRSCAPRSKGSGEQLDEHRREALVRTPESSNRFADFRRLADVDQTAYVTVLRQPAGVARGSGHGLARTETTTRSRRRQQAPRLPLAKHNKCIMFPSAGRLRSARWAVQHDSERDARLAPCRRRRQRATHYDSRRRHRARVRDFDALSDDGRACGAGRRHTPPAPTPSRLGRR